MFVCGNGCTKGDVAQMLQGIRKSIVRWVSGLPESVTRREFLWRKGGESQQVVRSVFDHVDSQVVPGVDAKVRPVCIAKGESFKFQKTVEGRVFYSLDLW